jgi:cobalt/nickel transport system ATP-binding protein
MVAIHVEDLNYSYPAGPRALDGVRLEITPGESIGLIGPNGAGKTTLFLCLAGILRVPPGKIQIAGLDPGRGEDRRRLPASVGVVFQDSDDQLFNSTVFDDVAFGPLNLGMSPEEVRQRVAEALDRVGLKGTEQRVPYHLSGGEKRRAALAGVLAMQPQVLLLDEPSSHLDPRGRRDLNRLLGDLPGTKVIATHDLEMVLELCPRAVILDRGRVAADGLSSNLLANAALMEAHALEVPHSLRPRPSGP